MRERGSQDRRSIRLSGYDYTQSGAYFVTVCVHNRDCSLGDLVDGETRLSAWGRVVDECWRAIPQHFPHAGLDVFVVMPNHIHGIIFLLDVGAQHAAPLRDAPLQQPRTHPASGSLSAIVRSLKSATTQRINRIRGAPGMPFWQRNYYEHVIRNQRDLNAIRRYIADNPLRWELDRENPHPAKPDG